MTIGPAGMRRAAVLRRKSLRRLAILRRLRRGRPYNRRRRQVRRWRIGSWNVRRWGSTGVPYDPWTKTVCLLRLAEKRRWDAILLADVRFESDGVHTVDLPRGGKWKIIVAGLVAVALSEESADMWETQGSTNWSPPRTMGAHCWCVFRETTIRRA